MLLVTGSIHPSSLGFFVLCKLQFCLEVAHRRNQTKTLAQLTPKKLQLNMTSFLDSCDHQNDMPNDDI